MQLFMTWLTQLILMGHAIAAGLLGDIAGLPIALVAVPNEGNTDAGLSFNSAVAVSETSQEAS